MEAGAASLQGWPWGQPQANIKEIVPIWEGTFFIPACLQVKRVTPGTGVSVSTCVKWGYKTIPFLPSKDAVESKRGLPGLGLQEAHELAKSYT